MNGLFDLDTFRQCRQAERLRKAGALPAVTRKRRQLPTEFRYSTIAQWLAAMKGATPNELEEMAEAPERDILVLPRTRHRIIREVAEKHGLDVEHMLSERRTKPLVEARLEAYCRLRKECPEMSLPAIGKAMGGRDHTTVLNAIRKHGHRFGLGPEHGEACHGTQ